MQFKKNQIIVMLFLAFMMNCAVAEKVEKKCDSSDWRCHGTFYLSGGYIFIHQFYTNHHLTEVIPEHSAINYTSQNAFPNNFNGVRMGFGSSFGVNSPFSFQLYYNQVLPQSKMYNGVKFSADGKLMLGLVQYAFNPKDRVRLSVIGGAGVVSSYLTITLVDHTKSFSQTLNSVDIDPIIGGDMAFQINSKYAVKLVCFWDFGTYNKDLKGRVVPAILFSYYP